LALAALRLGREEVRIAVLSAAVSTLAYLGGSRFTAIFHGASAVVGGLWSMISAVVVLQATRRATLTSAGLRILGTLIGAVISGLYLSVFPYSLIGMTVCIGLTVLLGQATDTPDHARLAAITVAVIMVTSSVSPTLSPLVNASLRFAESCIGAGITVLAAHLWPEAWRRS
jgi:uncharacterized membrane protein YccC